MDIAESVAPKTAFEIFGIKISESVVWGSTVVLALLFCALIIRLFVIPRFKTVPKGFQCILEWIVDSFDQMSNNSVGHYSKFLGPYVFGAAAFICFGVLIELVGIRSPLADINTCIALALSSFILINFFAIKKHGPVGRIKYYFKPVKFVAPIRFLSDLIIPVSMTFRLFGSILSGMLVMELVYSAFPYVFPALISPVFTLFHAIMQSYVFAVLTLTFTGEAIE